MKYLEISMNVIRLDYNVWELFIPRDLTFFFFFFSLFLGKWNLRLQWKNFDSRESPKSRQSKFQFPKLPFTLQS